MGDKNSIKKQLDEFNKKHEISSPHGSPVNAMDGITTCKCGAQWRTSYTDYGLQWKPLNRQATQHDKEQAALPDGYFIDAEGDLFYEPAP